MNRRKRRPPRSSRPAVPRPPQTAEEVSRLRRSGHGIWIQKSPPDHDVVRAAIRVEEAWINALPAHVAVLEQLFAGHDAFDVLAGVLLLEAEHRGRLPKARNPFLDGLMAGEIAAMVLLGRPDRAAVGVPKATLHETVAKAIPHLEALTMHAGPALSRLWHRSDAIAEIQERFVRRYMYVPINETDRQAHVWLLDLFDDPEVEEWLVREIGFGIADADDLVTSAVDLLGRQEASIDIRPGVGETFAFSTTELAKHAKVDTSVAKAFCARLSQPFGQPPRDWPCLPTPLRHRPLIGDNSEKYMLAAPPMLLRGLRHALAAALNPAIATSGPGDELMYQRYLARRGALVESRALTTLRELLKPAFTAQNLHFALLGKNHLEGEIDGLLVIDGTAIVLQAKSASTRIDALAGNAEDFAGALRAIVKESMRQHDDARTALSASREEVKFWTVEARGRVPVDVPELSSAEILPVTVTLEDLSGCAPASWELRDAGLSTSGQLPWIVAITPLETMISLLDFGAQLIHFLQRRSLLNESRNLDVTDEMDIFLEYLSDHLEIVHARRESQEGPVVFMPPERFHSLDAWLRAQREGDSSVKQPRQKLHRGLRVLLERLERDRPSGWLSIAVATLDAPKAYQKRIGASASAAFAGKHPHKPLGLLYETPAGDLVSLVILRETHRSRVDDVHTVAACRDQARRQHATALFALVVPGDHSQPLRTLWSGLVDIDG